MAHPLPGRDVRRGSAGPWDAWLALILVAAWQLTLPKSPVIGLPFWLAWLGIAVFGWTIWLVLRASRLPSRLRRVGFATATPSEWASVSLVTAMLISEVVALWVLIDLPIVTHIGLYDFRVYLAGGKHALDGLPVYLDHALTQLPKTASDDFFLYPPPLIPVFALLASLPYRIIAVAWVGFLVIAAILAFRSLGLGWGWAIVLTGFPGLVKGIDSGNVANVAFLLFALGPRLGWPLVLGALLKVQTAIPALWLTRQRRWRPLLIGVGLTAALGLLTLPFTGLESWGQWLAGLMYRQQSQVNLPILYGDSLAAFVPALVYVVVAAAAVAVALLARGRQGLAGLGLASIVASPTLWPHGFVTAIPALLGSRWASVVWLALGVGAGFDVRGYWAMTALAAIALLTRNWDETRITADRGHPLAGTLGPWSTSSPLVLDRAPS